MGARFKRAKTISSMLYIENPMGLGPDRSDPTPLFDKEGGFKRTRKVHNLQLRLMHVQLTGTIIVTGTSTGTGAGAGTGTSNRYKCMYKPHTGTGTGTGHRCRYSYR